MDDRISLKLFIALCRTYSQVTELVKKEIMSYNINLTEFEALELLYHSGPQAIQDIGKRVLLTSGSMTYVINQLEKKELVKRDRSESDKRIFYADITEKGRELMDCIFPKHKAFIDDMFSCLDEFDKENLLTSLKKVSHYEKE